MQGRLQLSCGYVDDDRMIIHDDNPNQGYFLAAGSGVQGRVQLSCGHVDIGRMIIQVNHIFLAAGVGGRVEVQGKEGNNSSYKSHNVSASLSLPESYKFLSRCVSVCVS